MTWSIALTLGATPPWALAEAAEGLDHLLGRAASQGTLVLRPPGGVAVPEWAADEIEKLRLGPPAEGAAPGIFPVHERGLIWLSSQEAAAQKAGREALSRQLAAFFQDSGAASEPRQRWLAWFDRLPVTGRVVLPVPDLYRMQLLPATQPRARAGDRLLVPPRLATVAVVDDQGLACRVAAGFAYEAVDYLRQCQPQGGPAADWAYLIQPEGTISRVSLQRWNEQTQEKPAPGAVIWLPGRDWPEHLALSVAEVLATQGSLLWLQDGAAGQAWPTHAAPAGAPSVAAAPTISASDWGTVGLIQTPTARMRPVGAGSFTLARTAPYTHISFGLQPYDWLEAGFRYTSISGRIYGSIAPNQSYKDKSIDVKVRLLSEGAYWPALALGWRDPLGTSLFAGEYLVANKRWGDLDFSLGMGWGYFGQRGNLRNPLAALGRRFETRQVLPVGEGGTAHTKSWFTGPVALFGGVQWQTPWQPLSLKLEYDGNDYSKEPVGSYQFSQRGPWNFGAVWQMQHMDLAAAIERGKVLTLGVTLHTDLSGLGQIKPRLGGNGDGGIRGLAYSTTIDRPQAPQTPLEQLLHHFSQATGWTAYALQKQGNEWRVLVNSDNGAFVRERLSQGLAALHQAAPAQVQGFRIVHHSAGVPVAEQVVDRAYWQRTQTELLGPSEVAETVLTATPPVAGASSQPVETLATLAPARWHVRLAPGFEQSLGGPDGYLYALYGTTRGRASLWPGGWVNGGLQFRMLDNYHKFTYTAPSNLPRVRTNIREYITTSRVNLPILQFNQMARLGENWFALGYAGYLESMYAGAGAELMYRPAQSPWAVGVDINRVRQRDFDQHLGLRSYGVTTGHLSLYWDTGWNDVFAKVSAGQYLAGDRGVTLDLSRQFKNGVRVGGWATKTNVSASKFGEGSFDKGIYVSIPFDAMFTPWAASSATLTWQPLIRDGGARLDRSQTLWDLTAMRGNRALQVVNPVQP